jgi:hypothetical protein
MSGWFGALWGAIFNNGAELELEGGLNFGGGLKATRNEAQGRIDIELNDEIFGPITEPVELANASVTVTLAQGVKRRLPADTLTGPRTITLDDAGIDSTYGGNVWEAWIYAQDYDLTIVNGGTAGGTCVVVTAGQARRIKLRSNTTDWSLLEQEIL